MTIRRVCGGGRIAGMVAAVVVNMGQGVSPGDSKTIRLAPHLQTRVKATKPVVVPWAWVLFATALVGGGLLPTPTRAAADDILFTAELNATGETWYVDSPATGFLELWLERETLRVRWKLTYQGLTSTPITAGLFGPEVVGFNAPLQIELGEDLTSPIEGEAVLNDGQFQYLITTRMYVNILTERYGRGEIRGHLRRTPTTKEPATQG